MQLRHMQRLAAARRAASHRWKCLRGRFRWGRLPESRQRQRGGGAAGEWRVSSRWSRQQGMAATAAAEREVRLFSAPCLPGLCNTPSMLGACLRQPLWLQPASVAPNNGSCLSDCACLPACLAHLDHERLDDAVELQADGHAGRHSEQQNLYTSSLQGWQQHTEQFGGQAAAAVWGHGVVLAAVAKGCHALPPVCHSPLCRRSSPSSPAPESSCRSWGRAWDTPAGKAQYNARGGTQAGGRSGGRQCIPRPGARLAQCVLALMLAEWPSLPNQALQRPWALLWFAQRCPPRPGTCPSTS